MASSFHAFFDSTQACSERIKKASQHPAKRFLCGVKKQKASLLDIPRPSKPNQGWGNDSARRHGRRLGQTPQLASHVWGKDSRGFLLTELLHKSEVVPVFPQ